MNKFNKKKLRLLTVNSHQLRRNLGFIILLTVLVGVSTWWGIWLYNNTGFNRSVSVDTFCGAVLFLSFLVAFIAYRSGKINAEYQKAEDRGDHFLCDSTMKRINMMIEHNDIKLQTIVAIANIMETRKPGLLPNEMMILKEDFDCYLGFMESIAILANRGSVLKESLGDCGRIISKV